MYKIVLMLPFFLISCAGLDYEYSNYMPDKKKDAFKESALILGIGVGYNTKYNTDLFFFTKETSSAGLSFNSYLDSLPPEEAEEFYVSAYRITRTTDFLVKHFLRMKKWREYNSLRTEISEASQKYYSQIEPYAKKRFSSDIQRVEKRKEEAAVKGILLIQEMENIPGEY